MATRTVPVSRRPLNLWERLYLGEVVRGVAITGTVFLRNFTLHTLHLFGIARGKAAAATIQFPEVERPIPNRYRTRHRLMKRDDGTARCVACMMCETVCPALTISIVAEEHPDPAIEKRPRSFVIDLGKCIYCGHCAEVCPCDAIRMDTKILDVATRSRAGMIYTKEDLLAWEERGDGTVVDLARRPTRETPDEVKTP